MRPLFCGGDSACRWAVLSGDPEDIYVTDALALDMFSDDDAPMRVMRTTRERVAFDAVSDRVALDAVRERIRCR